MRLEVLGCAGGIGDSAQTLAFLVDGDLLIEAGTGVGKLARSAMARIDHVFLSHGHLDHICMLPMLIDAGRTGRTDPVIVHALPATVETLQQHVFNWAIWPDFTSIPSASSPLIRFQAHDVGDVVSLGSRRITLLPATHSVPTAGFLLDSGTASIAISGDTTICPPFWETVGSLANLDSLIIEMSYHDGNADLARRAGHLCPSMLAPRLGSLKKPVTVYLVHVKPTDAERVAREIVGIGGIHSVRVMEEGQVLIW